LWRNHVHLRLLYGGNLLDRCRHLLVVEDVVATIEDVVRRLLLLLLAVVVDGRC
jgi:hypothetical protein